MICRSRRTTSRTRTRACLCCRRRSHVPPGTAHRRSTRPSGVLPSRSPFLRRLSSTLANIMSYRDYNNHDRIPCTDRKLRASRILAIPLMGSDVCSSPTLRFHLIFRSIGLIIATSALTMYTIIMSKPCANRE